MVEEELPEVLDIGEIKLTPDETFYYEAWGIRYKFRPTGEWRLVDNMSFRRKADAEDWMREKILKYEGMEGEVVPVKSCLLLKEDGNIKSWVEELS